MLEEISELAAAGAATVVGAMFTDGWEAAMLPPPPGTAQPFAPKLPPPQPQQPPPTRRAAAVAVLEGLAERLVPDELWGAVPASSAADGGAALAG
ncbi:hypothetical protein [Kitasatospora sp. NPDC094011]|uniref:hypothetical protein n=1 Tax=Kitasatospora sp. NPDC094011 TaxID=3364090 RepID=UPI00382F514E